MVSAALRGRFGQANLRSTGILTFGLHHALREAVAKIEHGGIARRGRAGSAGDGKVFGGPNIEARGLGCRRGVDGPEQNERKEDRTVHGASLAYRAASCRLRAIASLVRHPTAG